MFDKLKEKIGGAEPKAFWKSKTLQGVAMSLHGAVSFLIGHPMLLAPLGVLLGIDPAVLMKINAVLMVAGPLYSAYGRLRAGGGAPLVLQTTEHEALVKAVGEEKANALEALIAGGALQGLPLPNLPVPMGATPPAP